MWLILAAFGMFNFIIIGFMYQKITFYFLKSKHVSFLKLLNNELF